MAHCYIGTSLNRVKRFNSYSLFERYIYIRLSSDVARVDTRLLLRSSWVERGRKGIATN
jgi:hypothetical protein